MALPVTITGITFPPQNYYFGPFKSSGGNFYTIMRGPSGSTKTLRAMKATDPTSSWAEADAVNNTFVGDQTIVSLWVYQDGDTLHIVTADVLYGGSSTTDIKYHTFSMATDLWGTKGETVLLDVDNGPGTSPPASCSIGVRSDGDLIVLYNGDGDALMGTDYTRVDYARKESGTWTTDVAVDGAGEDHWYGSSLVMGSSDRAHFFYNNHDLGDVFQRTLTSANALQAAPTAFDTTAGALFHKFTNGVSFVSGADTKVRVAYEDSGGLLSIAGFNSADAPTPTIVATGMTAVTVSDVDSSDVASMAINGTTQWLLYVDETTDDLWRDNTGADNDTWGTDVELLDAVLIVSLSCNIYTRSGATVLGYVSERGATIYYDEYEITAAPPTNPEQKFWYRTMNVPGMRYPVRGLHIGRTW